LFVILLGSLFTGRLAVTFVLGPAFAAALVPIALLLCAAFVIGLGALPAFYLLAAGEGHWFLVANALASLVYLVCCWLLVPSLGPEGAALATGAAALAACALLLLRACTTCVRLRPPLRPSVYLNLDQP